MLKDDSNLEKVLEEARSFELSDSRPATIENAAATNTIPSSDNAYNVKYVNRACCGQQGHSRFLVTPVVVSITADTNPIL